MCLVLSDSQKSLIVACANGTSSVLLSHPSNKRNFKQCRIKFIGHCKIINIKQLRFGEHSLLVGGDYYD